jgi:hypothetical protein
VAEAGDASLALLDASGALLAASRDAREHRITFNSTEACVARAALPPGTYYLAVSSEPEMGQAGLEPFPNTGPQGYALTYTLHLGGTGCDIDRDTIEDSGDNCPVHANTAQEDADSDRVGDACDTVEPAPESPWSGFPGFPAARRRPPDPQHRQAGSTVPVKFSLGGDHGLDVFEAGYPRLTACDATPGAAQTSTIEETAGGAASALTYDAAADQYLYGWKTSKQLRGCVQLELTPDAGDGSPSPWARFWFK